MLQEVHRNGKSKFWQALDSHHWNWSSSELKTTHLHLKLRTWRNHSSFQIWSVDIEYYSFKMLWFLKWTRITVPLQKVWIKEQDTFNWHWRRSRIIHHQLSSSSIIHHHYHSRLTSVVENNIQEGAVVTMYDESHSRGLWRLGTVKTLVV